MKIKKCCYMDRDCTKECVAFTDAKELKESAKQMGMNDMNCMRVLFDFVNLMNVMKADDFDDEDEF